LPSPNRTGFTEQSFNACLANQKVLDGIESMRHRGANVFKVQSTRPFSSMARPTGRA